ncbi:hypothetical protein GGG87_06625 [Streptococcus sp. zg-86]|uniref:Uncharacterized protein n=1 Tax=Streptococcus zhangguiae TaxID=2664091 RepID=A0A6I4RFG5_9STRE|nr:MULTISPECIES: hypothetical protein [unclassified Streptococcus]MTB64667.1 hypothetical protein [Streptococcus sp. zg-86]MTB90977.1 hypothetical protein [Streptococcus sp. zg-36]MWV56600.1 hypothetical protein [Streptococcus sp. zg-70]QTH48560.1 hypothetical protein J5M87_04370 [Streptococcus sp. zg-86]
MNRLFNIILGLGFLLILGAGIYQMVKPNLPSLSTRDKQIAYLKEHEQEMTDYVKSQNPKIESVQWDWDSMEIKKVQPDAGGIPIGKKYNELNISGRFNHIEDSYFVLSFGFDIEELYPDMEHKAITQYFTINGGRELYE